MLYSWEWWRSELGVLRPPTERYTSTEITPMQSVLYLNHCKFNWCKIFTVCIYRCCCWCCDRSRLRCARYFALLPAGTARYWWVWIWASGGSNHSNSHWNLEWYQSHGPWHSEESRVILIQYAVNYCSHGYAMQFWCSCIYVVVAFYLITKKIRWTLD